MDKSNFVKSINYFLQKGKYILLGIVILLIILWLRSNPVSVEGYTAQYGDIVAEIMGTGTLEAHMETVISSKISGLLTKVLVDQEDMVKEGQLLVMLDDRSDRKPEGSKPAIHAGAGKSIIHHGYTAPTDT